MRLGAAALPVLVLDAPAQAAMRRFVTTPRKR
jgi:hypothetical protein